MLKPCTECGRTTAQKNARLSELPHGVVHRQAGMCRFCYRETMTDRRSQLSMAESLEIIDAAMASGIRDLVFIAGDLGIKPESLERMLVRWRRQDLLCQLRNRPKLSGSDRRKRRLLQATA